MDRFTIVMLCLCGVLIVGFTLAKSHLTQSTQQPSPTIGAAIHINSLEQQDSDNSDSDE